MAELSKSREAALKVLVAVEKDGAYINLCLRETLTKLNLDKRDSALATELSFGVMKNKLFLDNIISNISSVKPKKLSVWIHNILRIGIYSIRFLEKIPPRATVDECVRLSRRYGHRASAGFVNAVLRKSIECGDFLPQDTKSDEYISVKYSFPLWLVKKWHSYGEELFLSMNEAPPVTVRLNTKKRKSLEEGFEKTALAPHAYYFTRGGSVENSSEYLSGEITVQDEASQLAVSLLGIKEGDLVLDLCAAPGGKSTYAAALCGESGKVTSCDVHEHKLMLIDKNAERLALCNIETMLNDASVFNASFKEAFDVVIADVPCSGLGIIRRRPDIKWAKTEEGINELTMLQRKIALNAAQYVKKGGRLMYSTCTINKAENEENVKYFLENTQGFSLADGFENYGRQLLPSKDKTDGFFVAVFERK